MIPENFQSLPQVDPGAPRVFLLCEHALGDWAYTGARLASSLETARENADPFWHYWIDEYYLLEGDWILAARHKVKD